MIETFDTDQYCVIIASIMRILTRFLKIKFLYPPKHVYYSLKNICHRIIKDNIKSIKEELKIN